MKKKVKMLITILIGVGVLVLWSILPDYQESVYNPQTVLPPVIVIITAGISFLWTVIPERK